MVQKPRRTIESFFFRHHLSIKNPADVRMYLNTIQSGKRIETKQRSTAHLKPYQFKPKPEPNFLDIDNNAFLERGMERMLKREKWSDFLLIKKIFGAERIKDRIERQIVQEQRYDREPSAFLIRCEEYFDNP